MAVDMGVPQPADSVACGFIDDGLYVPPANAEPEAVSDDGRVTGDKQVIAAAELT